MQAFRISPGVPDMPVSGPPAAAPDVPRTGRMWPDEQAAPVRAPSPRRWLYLSASFAVGLAIDDPGTSGVDRMLSALGVVAVCAFVAAAFYVWRSATRPAIPATTLILAFLLTGGGTDRPGVAGGERDGDAAGDSRPVRDRNRGQRVDSRRSGSTHRMGIGMGPE